MPKYRVTYQIANLYSEDVEAANVEDASQAAFEIGVKNPMRELDSDVDIIKVEQIES